LPREFSFFLSFFSLFFFPHVRPNLSKIVETSTMCTASYLDSLHLFSSFMDFGLSAMMYSFLCEIAIYAREDSRLAIRRSFSVVSRLSNEEMKNF